MTNVTLNIGLNTNSGNKLDAFFVGDIVKAILKNSISLKDYQTRTQRSEAENTLIVSFSTTTHDYNIIPYIKVMADAFLQDCIAYKGSDLQTLVYSEYPQNDWGGFNEKYFINF